MLPPAGVQTPDVQTPDVQTTPEQQLADHLFQRQDQRAKLDQSQKIHLAACISWLNTCSPGFLDKIRFMDQYLEEDLPFIISLLYPRVEGGQL